VGVDLPDAKVDLEVGLFKATFSDGPLTSTESLYARRFGGSGMGAPGGSWGLLSSITGPRWSTVFFNIYSATST
jgi:hypothetical protein